MPGSHFVPSTLEDLVGDVVIVSAAQGDLLYRSASGTWTNLPTGTAGRVLTSGGAGANPSWAAVSAGVTSFNTRTGAVTLTTADVDAALPADVVQTDTANTFTVGPQTFQASAPTAPFGSGTSNERFGVGAGANGATGSYNMALGTNTLASLTSGNANVCIGHTAGFSLTTGVQNVAIGFTTLLQCGTGNDNVAVGQGALLATQGNSNVAVGSGSLSSVTNVTENVGIGVGAGSGLTTGSFNVFIGGSTSAASGSVQFGTAVGRSASTNSYGVALGYQAVAAANECAIGPNVTQQTFHGFSSTNTDRVLGTIAYAFVVSTDSSFTTRLTFSAQDYGGSREGVRIEGSGSAALVGFFGAGAVAKPTVTGSRAGNAALASLLSALASLGLITDSTT